MEQSCICFLGFLATIFLVTASRKSYVEVEISRTSEGRAAVMERIQDFQKFLQSPRQYIFRPFSDNQQQP
jgi:hypothetical protein